ncbi:MAG TPA: hypothetical protein VLF18_06850 [Tahibacter sp.]|uniref:hypothetical protein n=1 Tax=Tahibacter sp. TaxID=2056211 RepID=UPI002CFFDC4F|nr:hypothetical protein [Tahibacter sp.]HSX59899.1 hypothetical protein [Tahibacter sp.]
MNVAKKLFLAALATTPAWAGPVRTTLVTDANPSPVVADSNPSGFYAHDGLLYFTAWRADVGRQLFASDGVSAQARLVHDFSADGVLSNPYVLGRIGNRLIVSTQDVTDYPFDGYRHVLFALDLDRRQPTPLVEFAAQYNIYTWRIGRVGEAPGHVLFTDLVDGTVWSTDGTPEGTQRRYSPTPLDNSVSTRTACSLDDRVVFVGRNGSQRVLWTSDGTAQGTQAVTPLPESGFPRAAVRAGNLCHVLIDRNPGWALWSSDGTAAGTVFAAVADDNASGPLAAVGGAAFVLSREVLNNGNRFVRLFRGGQVAPVLDLPGMTAGDLANAGGRLAFAYRPSFGESYSILISDGTASGTHPATLAGVPLQLADAGPVVGAGGRFFVHGGDTLYAIDPLTAQATNLGSKPVFRSVWEIASLGAIAFDAIDDGVHGEELWRSNGTAAGTGLLHDIAQRTGDGVAAPYAGGVVRDGAVFFANAVYRPGAPASPLWRTDGTPAGTRALAHPAGSAVASIAAFDDGIVFSTSNANEPAARLYWTSRDFGATYPIWDLPASHALSASADGRVLVFLCTLPGFHNLSLCGRRDTDLQAGVLLSGGNDTGGRHGLIGGLGSSVILQFNDRLWRSDGTMPGTFEIAPGLAVTETSPNIAGVTAGGALLFMACLGPNGSDCGLHRSDGTAAGTYRLVSTEHDRFATFAPLGQRSIFSTYSGALWVTDGSVAGTQLLDAYAGIANDVIASTGTQVHFIARRYEPDEMAYIVTDGTPAGTRRVLPPAGFYPGTGAPLVVDADTVVFSCWGADTGYELCRVDGTGNDWALAADIAPGRRSSAPEQLARVGNVAYFTADDGHHGSELWRVEPFVDAIFVGNFQP